MVLSGLSSTVPPQSPHPHRHSTAAPPQTAPPTVALQLEVVDPVTEVRHRRAVVDDGHLDSATRSTTQLSITRQDDLLREHPEWAAPEVVGGRLTLHTAASRWFYPSASLREWRSALVPSAAALYPIQRPLEERLPSGGAIDEGARAFFTDTLDSIGVRTRALLMQDAVTRSGALAAPRHRGGRPLPWVSLACGSAVPVLDGLAALTAASGAPSADGGSAPLLRLVDQDPGALAFAARLASAQGLDPARDLELLQRDLVAGLVARDSLVDELGSGSTGVVDALGIFEYFRDASCVRLLHNAYRLLAPGGVLVVANMLLDRPQMEFNRRGAGWPRLFPRSSDHLVELVRRAGLPLDRTTISIPQDGVYAVVSIER